MLDWCSTSWGLSVSSTLHNPILLDSLRVAQNFGRYDLNVLYDWTIAAAHYLRYD